MGCASGFQSRGKADDEWLTQSFDELLGAKDLMLRVTVLERGRIVRSDSDAEGVELGTPSRRVLPQRLYDRLLRSEAAREDGARRRSFAGGATTASSGGGSA